MQNSTPNTTKGSLLAGLVARVGLEADIRRIVILLAGSLAAALFTSTLFPMQTLPHSMLRAFVQEHSVSIPHAINIQDAYSLVRYCPLLVDLRDTEDFTEGHVAGAINIPAEKVFEPVNLDRIRALSRGYTLIFYHGRVKCCAPADSIVRSLHKQGYRNVVAMDGGLPALKTNGLPTITGSAAHRLPSEE